MSQMPKCDSCDQQATTGVRDIRPNSKPEDIYETFEVVGPPRWGCADHPVESRELPRA